MNHLLITILYELPGVDPCMTTTVLRVANGFELTSYKDKIYQQYRNKPYYEVTITEV